MKNIYIVRHDWFMGTDCEIAFRSKKKAQAYVKKAMKEREDGDEEERFYVEKTELDDK